MNVNRFQILASLTPLPNTDDSDLADDIPVAEVQSQTPHGPRRPLQEKFAANFKLQDKQWTRVTSGRIKKRGGDRRLHNAFDIDTSTLASKKTRCSEATPITFNVKPVRDPIPLPARPTEENSQNSVRLQDLIQKSKSQIKKETRNTAKVPKLNLAKIAEQAKLEALIPNALPSIPMQQTLKGRDFIDGNDQQATRQKTVADLNIAAAVPLPTPSADEDTILKHAIADLTQKTEKLDIGSAKPPLTGNNLNLKGPAADIKRNDEEQICSKAEASQLTPVVKNDTVDPAVTKIGHNAESGRPVQMPQSYAECIKGTKVSANNPSMYPNGQCGGQPFVKHVSNQNTHTYAPSFQPKSAILPRGNNPSTYRKGHPGGQPFVKPVYHQTTHTYAASFQLKSAILSQGKTNGHAPSLPQKSSKPTVPRAVYPPGYGDDRSAPNYATHTAHYPIFVHERHRDYDQYLTFEESLERSLFLRAVEDGYLTREFCNMTVSRIMENQPNPMEKQRIIRDLDQNRSFGRLDVGAVGSWFLTRLSHTSASIVDRILSINLNIAVPNMSRSNACWKGRCIDPLCSRSHRRRISDRDEQQAFRCCVRILLKEAWKSCLLSTAKIKEIEKTATENSTKTERRVGSLRELALLIQIGWTPIYKGVVQQALPRFCALMPSEGELKSEEVRTLRVANTDNDDAEESDSVQVSWEDLDKDKVARKAIETAGNADMEAIWDVQRQKCNVGPKKAAVFLKLFKEQYPSCNPSVVTVPMLLDLLIRYTDKELAEKLGEGGVAGFVVKSGTKAKKSPEEKVSEIRTTALLRANRLNLTGPLGRRSEMEVYEFCATLPVQLSSVFSRIIRIDRPYDAVERNGEGNGANDWRKIAGFLGKWEQCDERYVTSHFFMYLLNISNRFAHQDKACDPRLYLTLLHELLDIYRNRAEEGRIEIARGDDRGNVLMSHRERDRMRRDECKLFATELGLLIGKVESLTEKDWPYVQALSAGKASIAKVNDVSHLLAKTHIS